MNNYLTTHKHDAQKLWAQILHNMQPKGTTQVCRLPYVTLTQSLEGWEITYKRGPALQRDRFYSTNEMLESILRRWW